MSVKLAIIIVNWNVVDLVVACLHSIRLGGIDESELRIIVVDNASSDDSISRINSEFPQVEVIQNSRNLGFTRANNQAITRCYEPYILLLNPDTLVRPGALRTMLDYMQGHPEVGVVGPRLIYGDGSPQPSRRRFPSLAIALAESSPWEWHFPANKLAKHYHMADTPDITIQSVDWITGACMLILRQALDQVGLFDEHFFMYSEEMDLCRRITGAGWQVIYLPQAVIVHLEGQSSGQVVAARHIRFNTSKVYYFKKHHGRFQAFILQIALLGMYACEWVLESLKWLFGHKRELRKARLKAYSQVIHSGLRLDEGG